MDRRSFIKLTAITSTSAALASCGNPEHQLIRFIPDDDIVPGQATWKPGVCPVCAAGCGLTVRVMDADAEVVRQGQAGVVTILAAKKLEGAPDYPVNRGGLCARGQAAIQLTYHPDRITQPLTRAGDRGSGQYEAISWEDALAALTAQLNGLQSTHRPQALGVIARPGGGHRALGIDQWLQQFGAPAAVRYELFGEDVLRRANALSFGRHQLPSVDLARARFVMSFGADFLGTWNSPVAQAWAYGEMRQGRRGVRGHVVQVEARMSQTGASADEWVPARPGTEGVLALGLAHVMLTEQLRPAANAGRAGELVAGWAGGLADYTPDAVATATGVDARRVQRLARELADGPASAALVGGPALAHSNALFTALAVNALNALLGTVGQPGGLYFTPQPEAFARPAGAPSGAAALQALLASSPHVVLLDGANPVFTAPPAWRVRDALAQVPFIASFGSFLDETSVLADLVLPDHSFLESWIDAVPESGSATAVAAVAAPTMRPLHQTRSTVDVLLEVGRGLGTPLSLPWQTYDELIGASFGEAWAQVQEKGWGELAVSAVAPARPSGAPAPAPQAVAAPTFDGDAAAFPFHFLPYPTVQFGEGETAHLPWLQEMPDPLTSAMWSSWVEINPHTAARLGIGMGDLVEVTSTQGRLRAPAYVSPAIAPDVVAMPAGQGHQHFTRYATGRGASPVPLLAPVTEPVTGALAWAATRVQVTRVGHADGRLILFAGGLREHLEEGR